MKQIIKYECEICGQKFDTEEGATTCEAKGIFNEKMYPAGLMWEYHHHGFVGIFSLPKNVKKATESIYNKNHVGDSSYWACRTNGYPGDSLGKQLCGGDYFYSNKEEFDQWKKHHHIASEKTKSPEFKRMVQFLKSQRITPSYYTPEGELITVK